MGISLRERDITGAPFPQQQQQTGIAASIAVLSLRPAHIEPPPGAREFIVSYSASVAGAGAATALFSFTNNVLDVPSCGVVVPDNTTVRISGVSIGGDTDVGAPVLTFSIRSRDGQQFIGGWEGIGLPGRGGVIAVGFEPFTVIDRGVQFFGGWVVNSAAGAKYAEMMIQGWYW